MSELDDAQFETLEVDIPNSLLEIIDRVCLREMRSRRSVLGALLNIGAAVYWEGRTQLDRVGFTKSHLHFFEPKKR